MNESRTPPGRGGENLRNVGAANEERLEALFQAYREACEPRDASVNFMPELWQKIERAQAAAFSFRRIAKGFVTAAAALSLGLAAISLFHHPTQNAPITHTSYIEALAAHSEALDARNVSESVEYVLDLVHPDPGDEPSEEI
jgi:hypothetical protein